MADYFCWPWVERFPALEEFSGVALLQDKLFPKLCSWYKAMADTPGVKATRTSTEETLAYFNGVLSGDKDFDFAQNA